MDFYNNLPLIYLDVNDDITGLEYISLVNRPAIMRNFITLSADEREVKFSLNEERHIVTGACMIPDLKVYRCDKENGEYYISFSKEAIENIMLKFFKNYTGLSANLEHSQKTDDAVIFESYLIDKERGICPIALKDLPDGTWVVSMKILSEALWEDIKEGKFNGFSIEGWFQEPKPKKSEEINTLDELMNYLNNK